MKFNFVLPYQNYLEESDEKAIENYVINIINKSKDNNNKLTLLILEASSCLYSSDSRINHIYTDGFLSNISNSINGYSEKIKRNSNYNILLAQKASLKVLEILAEQNNFNIQSIISINNKINNIHIELKKELKRIYGEIRDIYEHSIEKIKNNVSILQLSQNIKIYTYNDIYYKDLDKMAKIVCIANDFYNTSKNNYNNADFIALKSIINDLDLDLNSSVKTIDFYNYILKNPSIIDRLYKDIKFDNIDNITPWFIAISSGIKKLISLSENENYILKSISRFSDKNKDEVKIILTDEYLKNTADFDINKDIKVDEFIIMITNDLAIIDSYVQKVYEDNIYEDTSVPDTKTEVKNIHSVSLEDLFEKNRLYELIFECNTIIQLKNKKDDSDIIKAYKYRTDALIKLGNGIFKEFDKVIELYPNNIDLYIYKSRYLFSKKMYLSSIEVLQDCIEKCGKDFTLLFEKIKIKDFLLSNRMQLAADFFEENLLELLENDHKKGEKIIDDKKIEDLYDNNLIFKSAVSIINKISNIMEPGISRIMDDLSNRKDLEKLVKDFIEEIKEAKSFNPEDSSISYLLSKYQYIQLSLEYGYISTLTDFKQLRKIENTYFSICDIDDCKYNGDNIKDKHKDALIDIANSLENIGYTDNENVFILLALIYKVNSRDNKLLEIKKNIKDKCMKNKSNKEYFNILFDVLL